MSCAIIIVINSWWWADTVSISINSIDAYRLWCDLHTVATKQTLIVCRWITFTSPLFPFLLSIWLPCVYSPVLSIGSTILWSHQTQWFWFFASRGRKQIELEPKCPWSVWLELSKLQYNQTKRDPVTTFGVAVLQWSYRVRQHSDYGKRIELCVACCICWIILMCISMC